MNPSTNTGIAEAAAVPIVVILSVNEYRRIADISPTEMPTTISMIVAQIARRMLRGAFSEDLVDAARSDERFAEVPLQHRAPSS